MLRMSAIVLFCFPRWMALRRLGMAMAAMMPMIATTMSSSISVKPLRLLRICIIVSPTETNRSKKGAGLSLEPQELFSGN
jgi:hypothetical protein